MHHSVTKLNEGLQLFPVLFSLLLSDGRINDLLSPSERIVETGLISSYTTMALISILLCKE